MVGFLKKLGSMFSGEAAPAKPDRQESYEGYVIASTPISEGGQFRLCGVITKDVGGEEKTHRYIRADVCQSKDQADDLAIMKGKQMIDQLGDRIFQP